jgi:hypothetical protein
MLSVSLRLGIDVGTNKRGVDAENSFRRIYLLWAREFMRVEWFYVWGILVSGYLRNWQLGENRKQDLFRELTDR